MIIYIVFSKNIFIFLLCNLNEEKFYFFLFYLIFYKVPLRFVLFMKKNVEI